MIFLWVLFSSIGMFAAGADEPATLWEYRLRDFSTPAYTEAVEALLADFEKKTGKPFSPGVKGKVALKVNTAAGEGLSTPRALVRAVIAALCKRGYKEESIIIFDLSARMLRDAGFLPPLSAGGKRIFDRSPVCTIEDADFQDAQWFYESPLPPLMPILPRSEDWKQVMAYVQESKKSYLPVPLFFDVDFWINLPVGMDSRTLGVACALANATLWNATNTARFWQSPSFAPMAVAEMAAIPELKASMAFTILSLENYQFVGESTFNSLYTASEKRLWLSDNSVFLDYALLRRLNFCRKRGGFEPYEPTPRAFECARLIGLGDYRQGQVIEVHSKE